MDRRFDSDSAASAVRDRDRPMLLMIEDDPDDRAIYGDMLCYNGYDVVLAGNVAEGLRAAEQHRPDLVLLDMGLPDGSGLEVCVELRRQDADCSVPIIALSAFPHQEFGARAADAGCTIYIEKPASPIGVLHHIEQLIGRAPMPGEGRPPRIIE
ncbi:hypothetical protein BH23GEM10_BH23GEM10_15740 [soil metagenome]